MMKLYLWDKAATDFCQKFKLYGSTPSVLLVTTVNPKHFGGQHISYKNHAQFRNLSMVDDNCVRELYYNLMRQW